LLNWITVATISVSKSIPGTGSNFLVLRSCNGTGTSTVPLYTGTGSEYVYRGLKPVAGTGNSAHTGNIFPLKQNEPVRIVELIPFFTVFLFLKKTTCRFMSETDCKNILIIIRRCKIYQQCKHDNVVPVDFKVFSNSNSYSFNSFESEDFLRLSLIEFL
jgi:hypothetical protein